MDHKIRTELWYRTLRSYSYLSYSYLSTGYLSVQVGASHVLTEAWHLHRDRMIYRLFTSAIPENKISPADAFHPAIWDSEEGMLSNLGELGRLCLHGDLSEQQALTEPQKTNGEGGYIRSSPVQGATQESGPTASFIVTDVTELTNAAIDKILRDIDQGQESEKANRIVERFILNFNHTMRGLSEEVIGIIADSLNCHPGTSDKYCFSLGWPCNNFEVESHPLAHSATQWLARLTEWTCQQALRLWSRRCSDREESEAEIQLRRYLSGLFLNTTRMTLTISFRTWQLDHVTSDDYEHIGLYLFGSFLFGGYDPSPDVQHAPWNPVDPDLILGRQHLLEKHRKLINIARMIEVRYFGETHTRRYLERTFRDAKWPALWWYVKDDEDEYDEGEYDEHDEVPNDEPENYPLRGSFSALFELYAAAVSHLVGLFLTEQEALEKVQDHLYFKLPEPWYDRMDGNPKFVLDWGTTLCDRHPLAVTRSQTQMIAEERRTSEDDKVSGKWDFDRDMDAWVLVTPARPAAQKQHADGLERESSPSPTASKNATSPDSAPTRRKGKQPDRGHKLSFQDKDEDDLNDDRCDNDELNLFQVRTPPPKRVSGRVIRFDPRLEVGRQSSTQREQDVFGPIPGPSRAKALRLSATRRSGRTQSAGTRNQQRSSALNAEASERGPGVIAGTTFANRGHGWSRSIEPKDAQNEGERDEEFQPNDGSAQEAGRGTEEPQRRYNLRKRRRNTAEGASLTPSLSAARSVVRDPDPNLEVMVVIERPERHLRTSL